MVLLTTLTDAQIAPKDVLIALYSERWGIETFNRELKTIYQVERFRSRTAERVEEELYACLTRLTIAAAAQSAVDQTIRKKHDAQKWNDPHRAQVRRTYLFTIVTHWAQQVMAGTVTTRNLMEAMTADIADLVRYAVKKPATSQRITGAKTPQWQNSG